MSSEVKNPPDYDQFLIERIVHGVREPLGQEAVIAEDLWMDACVKQERVYVGEKGIKEVLAQSFALLFVEKAPGIQIFHG
jgi:hypothetical protein